MLDFYINLKIKKNIKDRFKRARHDKHGDFLSRVSGPIITDNYLSCVTGSEVPRGDFLPTRLSRSFFIL